MKKINSLGLFLTRRCNFRCIYCNTENITDQSDKMSMVELKSAVIQAKSMGARWIVVPGEGEPFLDEYLFDLIDLVTKEGLYIKIYTNGSLIDSVIAERLLGYRAAIVFKLHAFSPSIYNHLSEINQPVEWVKLQDSGFGKTGITIPIGLNYLLEAGYTKFRASYKGESLLQIETVVVKQNLSEIPKIARWCKSYKIDLLVETLIRDGRAKINSNILGVEPSEEENLYKELRAILGWRFMVSQKIRCRFETNPFLDSAGNLRHCFGLAGDFGNIRTASLADLHHKELRFRKENGMFNRFYSFGYHGFRNCATRKTIHKME